MKKLIIFVLLVVLASTLFADKVLLWKPIFKGDFESQDKKTLSRTLKKVFDKRFNYIYYRNLASKKRKRFAKCGGNEMCWADKASDENFSYVALALFKMTEDEEIRIRIMMISIEDEEVIGDVDKTYYDIDEANYKAISRQIKKSVGSSYKSVKKGSSGGGNSRNSELEKRKRLADEREQKAVKERKRREATRLRKLEKERERREQERERKMALERKKRKEKARKKKIAAEKKRRKEAAERRRLEKEMQKREKEKAVKKKQRRASMRKNAEKLSRARELVLEWVQEGKYGKAAKAITKVSQIKCECEEDAKVLALKTQLLNFHKVVQKILQGVKLLDDNLILDNIEAAKALDEELVEGGTNFSTKVDKYYSVGFYARGLEASKKDNYTLADESFNKCLEYDPDNQDCQRWLDSKDKLVEKIYKKADVMRNFNPTKAKELFKSILRLVTADHDYYKKAEKALERME
ncbi:hypothetical protein KAH37_05290 [bacterium]|nr:hypothetical protein [bacterium]